MNKKKLLDDLKAAGNAYEALLEVCYTFGTPNPGTDTAKVGEDAQFKRLVLQALIYIIEKDKQEENDIHDRN